jgi:hypothetical protein|tara:strand:+ start:240 stop:785 length:546 start_codon:yes stop_codon:yes gene_type:complete
MKLSIPIIMLFFIIGCTAQVENIETEQIEKTEGVVKMKITSPAFKSNQEIPAEFTCDGQDLSPELNFWSVPDNAKSLVLIMDDPDAPGGNWDHWIAFNINPKTNTLPRGIEKAGVAGKNSWGRTGYGGPCPPSGTHRYIFKLYALDKMLDLKEGASKSEIENAMQGHIIEKEELIGLYKRQ